MTRKWQYNDRKDVFGDGVCYKDSERGFQEIYQCYRQSSKKEVRKLCQRLKLTIHADFNQYQSSETSLSYTQLSTCIDTLGLLRVMYCYHAAVHYHEEVSENYDHEIPCALYFRVGPHQPLYFNKVVSLFLERQVHLLHRR